MIYDIIWYYRYYNIFAKPTLKRKHGSRLLKFCTFISVAVEAASDRSASKISHQQLEPCLSRASLGSLGTLWQEILGFLWVFSLSGDLKTAERLGQEPHGLCIFNIPLVKPRIYIIYDMHRMHRSWPSPRAVHLHWVLQHQQNLRRGDQSKSTEK